MGEICSSLSYWPHHQHSIILDYLQRLRVRYIILPKYRGPPWGKTLQRTIVPRWKAAEGLILLPMLFNICKKSLGGIISLRHHWYADDTYCNIISTDKDRDSVEGFPGLVPRGCKRQDKEKQVKDEVLWEKGAMWQYPICSFRNIDPESLNWEFLVHK